MIFLESFFFCYISRVNYKYLYIYTAYIIFVIGYNASYKIICNNFARNNVYINLIEV